MTAKQYKCDINTECPKVECHYAECCLMIVVMYVIVVIFVYAEGRHSHYTECALCRVTLCGVSLY